eukprot:2782063-Pyramimonas_sp.AAC.1
MSLMFAACGDKLKPDESTRLIGPLDPIIRIRSRVRQPVSAVGTAMHRSSHPWGTGPGRSASASAFSPSLDNKFAVAISRKTVALMMEVI